MGLPVVIGQLEIDWDPAGNRERVISFLRTETRPGSLAVLPEAALSGYDDQLSGLDRLDARALAASLAAVADAARELGVHVLCGSLLPEPRGWSNAGIYFGPPARAGSTAKSISRRTNVVACPQVPRCRCCA